MFERGLRPPRKNRKFVGAVCTYEQKCGNQFFTDAYFSEQTWHEILLRFEFLAKTSLKTDQTTSICQQITPLASSWLVCLQEFIPRVKFNNAKELLLHSLN